MKLHGCEDCAYYEKEGEGRGRCHRYPPQADCFWPLVMSDHWCGELKMSAKPPQPVNLPDDLKAILDRHGFGNFRKKSFEPEDQWRPVKVPLTGCRECNGTGHSYVDTELHCPACQGLGLQRRGEGE